jgi:hypothetical protein
MIQVQDAQAQGPARRQFYEDVQQADGIRASGHGHANLVTALEHVITRNGFGDALEHSLPAPSL